MSDPPLKNSCFQHHHEHDDKRQTGNKDKDFQTIVRERIATMKTTNQPCTVPQCTVHPPAQSLSLLPTKPLSPPRIPLRFVAHEQRIKTCTSPPRQPVCREKCMAVQRAICPKEANYKSEQETVDVPAKQSPVLVQVFQSPPNSGTDAEKRAAPIKAAPTCGHSASEGKALPVETASPQAQTPIVRPLTPAEEWAQLTKMRLDLQTSTTTPVDLSEKETSYKRSKVLETHHVPGQPCTVMGAESLRSQMPGRKEEWTKVVRTQKHPGPEGKRTTDTGFYGIVRQETVDPDYVVEFDEEIPSPRQSPRLAQVRQETVSPECFVDLEKNCIAPRQSPKQSQVTMPDSFLQDFKDMVTRN